jgi:hypothetical protein
MKLRNKELQTENAEEVGGEQEEEGRGVVRG